MTASATPLPDSFDVLAATGFGLVELRTQSPLLLQLLPTGAVFAIRHDSLLLNQVLPGPAEDGLFRLLLRWRRANAVSSAAENHWAPLVCSGIEFARSGPASAVWRTAPLPGLECETELELHPTLPAWIWRVRVRNGTGHNLSLDVLHAQDLGLGDEGGVRNNEAYTSQYLDLLPVRDDQLGWTILARQNQPASKGRHPWLALGCTSGAEAFCTDGWQFFGSDHRLTNVPAAVRSPHLPSQRLQYEFALAGLESRAVNVTAGKSAQIAFVARFVEDHPAASGAGDLGLLRVAFSELLPVSTPQHPPAAFDRSAPSLFTTAPLRHGEEPRDADLDAWFPGPHRHLEQGADGRTLAFFCGDDVHVVTRAKEQALMRPHGHVLRSGDSTWNDEGQFGVTAYAAGIFSAQTYLGNPSIARLLPVVRNALGLLRGAGQRVFVRRGDAWQQLGIPSVFALAPGEVRWIYRLASDVIEARVWCSAQRPVVFLELQVREGPPCEFLVTHQLALGANEFEHGGRVSLHRDKGWIECTPAPESLLARHVPGVRFAIAAAAAQSAAQLGGDELIWSDRSRTGGPYVSVRTPPVDRCGILQAATAESAGALAALVDAARDEFASGRGSAARFFCNLRLSGGTDPGVARLNEVLPWYDQNASIHFAAPRGLEQYGGAAWGVRDVCQGSVEWLLASGEFAIVRRVLTTVFAQQYLGSDGESDLTGTWPQWFMFPPFHFIQHPHSHGDVCFWPVKALCDYIEASNDLTLLDTAVDYTQPRDFSAAGRPDSIWAHCDRVIAHVESRFVPGTALVNYGDGDWDDTLQPADPAMRKRMISAWTVALAYHTFRQLRAVCEHAGAPERAQRLSSTLGRIRADFVDHLMPAGVVAGFLVTDSETGPAGRPLLHPQDRVTGIRYRLLPMTRSVLAELFTPEEAKRHLEIVEQELRFRDGVRLMSEPAVYHGGLEKLFKRAETAANVGREIGLQYVHAHLRYAEAMAKVGDADRLWWALQVVNPVGLEHIVAKAAPRQSNVYFSSSDADFADRYEAAARWSELRSGQVAVRGGWRLYSSGPGLFLHKVRTCLVGLRETFDEVVFDPVLPRALSGLVVVTHLLGRPVEINFVVTAGSFAPRRVAVNGTSIAVDRREPNPYRAGGVRIARSALLPLLASAQNRIAIEL